MPIQNRTHRTSQQTSNDDMLESAINVSPLPFAVHGEFKQNGEPCVLMQTGDVPGHSPSYLAIDADGESEWVSFADIRVTDQRARPVPAQLQTQTTTARSRR